MEMKQLLTILSREEKKELFKLLSEENELNKNQKLIETISLFDPTDCPRSRTNRIISYLLSIKEEELANQIGTKFRALQITPFDKYLSKFLKIYHNDIKKLVESNPENNILTFIGFKEEYSASFKYYYKYYLKDSEGIYFSIEE